MGDAIVEAKAFAPSTYRTYEAGGIEAFPHYAWQTSVEMVATGMDLLFVVGVKNDDGVVERIYTEVRTTPIFSRKEIEARVLEVVGYVEEGVVPGCEYKQFPCPYFADHDEDDPLWQEEPRVELEGRARKEVRLAVLEYERGKTMEARGKAMRGEARGKVLGLLGENHERHGRYSAGAFRITSSETKGRTTYDYKAMEADGVDLGKYRKVGKPGERLDVETEFDDD